MNGTEFGTSLLGLTGIARENQILRVALKQGLAQYAGGDGVSTLRVEQMIAGKNRVLEMNTAPLPAAIGTPDDMFFFPAWPWTYQAIASTIGCVLPTQKMVMLRAKVAPVRVEPRPYPTCNPKIPGICNGVKGSASDDGGKYNESSERWIESNNQAKKDLTALALSGKYTPGQLVRGLGKSVVVGPNLDGSRVAIFGWFHAMGDGSDTPASRWQPYSTVHEATYGADYAHRWDVFQAQGTLNGSPVALADIASDKLLHVLLSDQGPLLLTFPSVSGGGVAPPPGYPPGTFAPGGPSKLAQGAAQGVGVTGGVVLGGTIGFAVGGPVGAAVGALFGAALGKA